MGGEKDKVSGGQRTWKQKPGHPALGCCCPAPCAATLSKCLLSLVEVLTPGSKEATSSELGLGADSHSLFRFLASTKPTSGQDRCHHRETSLPSTLFGVCCNPSRCRSLPGGLGRWEIGEPDVLCHPFLELCNMSWRWWVFVVAQAPTEPQCLPSPRDGQAAWATGSSESPCCLHKA